MTERMIYQRMMPAKQLSANMKHGKQPRRNIYFTLLSLQLKFLNLSANRGNSDTRRKQNISMNRKRNMALNLPLTRKACCPTIRLPQNKAFAGVGKPIKEDVCLVSMLNLANRKAEKAHLFHFLLVL